MSATVGLQPLGRSSRIIASSAWLIERLQGNYFVSKFQNWCSLNRSDFSWNASNYYWYIYDDYPCHTRELVAPDKAQSELVGFCTAFVLCDQSNLPSRNLLNIWLSVNTIDGRETNNEGEIYKLISLNERHWHYRPHVVTIESIGGGSRLSPSSASRNFKSFAVRSELDHQKWSTIPAIKDYAIRFE